jgi:uncharacterized membrane protein
MTFIERAMEVFLWALVALYAVVRVWAVVHDGKQSGATVREIVSAGETSPL